MNLYFHEGFKLERENLTKILSLISRNPQITNVQIAEEAGIGIGKKESQGKVKPTINYGKYGGLLKESETNGARQLNFTDVGKVILANDPSLRKPTTQWVIHYHLSKNNSEAGVWTFFIHDFLPKNGEFGRSQLEDALVNRFQVKPRSTGLGALLNCYVGGSGLERIRLVREQAKSKYARAQSYIPNAYTVAYILAEIWEAQHPERSMVDPAQLLEPGHLATTMNLSEREVTSWLNELSAFGIVKQMREAPPYQVARQWRDKLELLQKSYDEEG